MIDDEQALLMHSLTLIVSSPQVLVLDASSERDDNRSRVESILALIRDVSEQPFAEASRVGEHDVSRSPRASLQWIRNTACVAIESHEVLRMKRTHLVKKGAMHESNGRGISSRSTRSSLYRDKPLQGLLLIECA